MGAAAIGAPGVDRVRLGPALNPNPTALDRAHPGHGLDGIPSSYDLAVAEREEPRRR